ncbi:hypothetical protein M758_2G216100 [Ceratodon purpureus]|nr:hypothetical protein M758_2G216100 [Ceratodon purpureus]
MMSRCVIVKDGEVIGRGSNRTNETRNATRHAEMEAIDMVLSLWQQPCTAHSDNVSTEGFQQCDLYVTCEPCIMCASALSLLGTYSVLGFAGNKLQNSGSKHLLVSFRERLVSHSFCLFDDVRVFFFHLIPRNIFHLFMVEP